MVFYCKFLISFQKCIILLHANLTYLLDGRVEKLFQELNNSISVDSLVVTITLKKLQLVLTRFSALAGLLVSHLRTSPSALQLVASSCKRNMNCSLFHLSPSLMFCDVLILLYA